MEADGLKEPLVFQLQDHGTDDDIYYLPISPIWTVSEEYSHPVDLGYTCDYTMTLAGSFDAPSYLYIQDNSLRFYEI